MIVKMNHGVPALCRLPRQFSRFSLTRNRDRHFQYSTRSRFHKEHKNWQKPKTLSWFSAGTVATGLTVTLMMAKLNTKKDDGINSTENGAPHLAPQSSPDEGAHSDSSDTKPPPSSMDFGTMRAITESKDLLQRIKDEVGSPGMVVAVSVNGKLVWSQGLGYADVENRVLCHPDTVMRIASISKPISMALIAKLWQDGKLNLDKPVQHYVPAWPEKIVDGEEVSVTTRHLVSHLGGIRHYDKTCQGHRKKKMVQVPTAKFVVDGKATKGENEIKKSNDKSKDVIKAIQKSKNEKTEFQNEEYFIRKHFPSVAAALDVFKNDPLCSKPGSEYLYTTHGWTLLSAVVEGATQEKFDQLIKLLFKDLNMNKTYLDENDPIIYNRAKFYVKNKAGRLINARYVNCSYKWAGGGMLSTVADLVRFGDAMLYSYQQDTQAPYKPGYLDSSTVKAMWTPVDKTKCDWDANGFYGMGWGVVPAKSLHPHCLDQRFYVSHTGGAIGGSSVLLVLPSTSVPHQPKHAHGVVVSIVTNMQGVGLNKTALQIAKIFDATISKAT